MSKPRPLLEVALRAGWFPLSPRASSWLALGLALVCGWRPQGVSEASGCWDRFTQLTDAEGASTRRTSRRTAARSLVSRSRGTWDVYVQRVGGGTRSLAAGDPVREGVLARFSPDGRFIAPTRHDAASSSSAPRRVGASPDGLRGKSCGSIVMDRLLAATGECRSAPLRFASGSQLTVIVDRRCARRRPLMRRCRSPRGRPSGRRIAFLAPISQRDPWLTVAADGTSTSSRSPTMRRSTAPAWSPDGSTCIASNRGGSMGPGAFRWTRRVDSRPGCWSWWQAASRPRWRCPVSRK